MREGSWVERLLRIVVGDAEAADGILGDLHEEFDVESAGAGHHIAHAWAVVRLTATYAFARLVGGVRRLLHPRAFTGLGSEARQVFRSLARTPGFTTLAVMTVALGVTANTLVFSVVDGVLLRPAAFPNAIRAVYVWVDDPTTHRSDWPLNYPAFERLRAEAETLENVGVSGQVHLPMVGPQGSTRVTGVRVSASLFDVAGSVVQIGRALLESDDRVGADPVVVIADAFWEEHFERDPRILGRSVTLGESTYAVVGVLNRGFRMLEPVQVRNWREPVEPAAFYIPIAPFAAAQGPESFSFPLHGTLADGATLSEARQEIRALTAPIWAGLGGRHAAWEADVATYNDFVGGPMRPALLALLAAVALVVLVVCANLSALLLVRGAGRRTEWSVRKALGAGPLDVFRYAWIESLLIAGGGGIAGGLLAWFAIDQLPHFVPHTVPRLEDVRLDGRVLTVTALTAGTCSFLFGGLPAWWTSRQPPSRALNSRSRILTLGTRRALEAAVALEVAVAVVLLVSGGLLLQSFGSLVESDKGYQTRGVLVSKLQLAEAQYPTETDIAEFVREAASQLRMLSGVQQVGAASFSFELSPTVPVSVVGRDDEARSIPQLAVMPGTFQALDMGVVEGRGFTIHDDESVSAVAIVSASVAKALWPGESAIGQHIESGSARRYFRGGAFVPETPREVVGVATDVYPVGAARRPLDMVYLPWAQDPWDRVIWLVRSHSDDPALIAPAVEATLAGVDSSQPLFDREPFDAVFLRSLATERFSALLVGAFALVALALAALGLYGAVSYTVVLRTPEIGMRVALGAGKSSILAGVLRPALRPVFAGIVIGIPLALIAGLLIEGLLFGVSPTDLSTVFTVSIGIIGVSLVAALGPAHRAALLDPMKAFSGP